MIKKIGTYSLKVAVGRKEHPIPVVSDIYLHSLYDPIKEADAFIQKNREKVSQSDYFLILGLGFAYHVNRLISELKSRQSGKWGVTVIEPNIRVYKECINRGLVAQESELRIFQGMEVEALYAEKELVDFMMLKPAVLVQDTSYNLYLDYYKNFLNYRAGTKAKEIASGVNDKGMQEYLLKHGSDDIHSLNESVKEKAVLSKEEMLLGAFFKICEEAIL